MRPPLRIAVRAALAAALLACAFGLASDAGQEIDRWHQQVIRIADRTDRGVSLARAVRRWNSAGLGVRFELVADARRADVVARSSRRFIRGCRGANTIGCATVGSGLTRPWRTRRYLALIPRERGEADNGSMEETAAHELGHVLGLRHTRATCELMNSGSACRSPHLYFVRVPGCPVRMADGLDPQVWCPQKIAVRRLCGPTRSEIKHLVAYYGGELDPAYSPWCERRWQRPWSGWCAYPDWVPAGERRPTWQRRGRDGRWHCTSATPGRALGFVVLALTEVQKQIAEAHRRGVTRGQAERRRFSASLRATLAAVERRRPARSPGHRGVDARPPGDS